MIMPGALGNEESLHWENKLNGERVQGDDAALHQLGGHAALHVDSPPPPRGDVKFGGEAQDLRQVEAPRQRRALGLVSLDRLVEARLGNAVDRDQSGEFGCHGAHQHPSPGARSGRAPSDSASTGSAASAALRATAWSASSLTLAPSGVPAGKRLRDSTWATAADGSAPAN